MGVKVELLRDWRCYRKGHQLDTSGGVADLLVNRRKIARYVEEEKPETCPQRRKGK